MKRTKIYSFLLISIFSLSLNAASPTCELVLTMTEELERDGLAVQSPSMQAALLKVAKFANHDVTVLITGETGTGKEVIASLLHQYSSKRKVRNFVVVDSTRIKGDTAITELFGHEMGAFTGAIKKNPGLLASANGGTVFVDEAADLTPDLQAALLRFTNTEAEDRMVRSVGSDRSMPVNVRLVIATNQDLGDMVADGRFRSDLYYRLNIARIDLKPLREMPNEIVPIAEKILVKTAKKYRRSFIRFSDSARLILRNYSWPGNIRQLAGVIERSVLLGEDNKEILDKSDLNFDDERYFTSKVSVLDLAGKPGIEQALKRIEALAYRDAFLRANRQQNEAAKLLDISPRMFNYWWNKDRGAFPDLFPEDNFGPLPNAEAPLELKKTG